MSRGKWKWDAERECLVEVVEKRAEVEAPAVITDEIPGGLESMVDGKIYTSKARLRQHYRERGYVEKGNDRQVATRDEAAYDRQMEEDAERTYYEVRDGMAPLSELDRERCKLIDHSLETYSYDRRERDRDGNPLD